MPSDGFRRNATWFCPELLRNAGRETRELGICGQRGKGNSRAHRSFSGGEQLVPSDGAPRRGVVGDREPDRPSLDYHLRRHHLLTVVELAGRLALKLRLYFVPQVAVRHMDRLAFGGQSSGVCSGLEHLGTRCQRRRLRRLDQVSREYDKPAQFDAETEFARGWHMQRSRELQRLPAQRNLVLLGPPEKLRCARDQMSDCAEGRSAFLQVFFCSFSPLLCHLDSPGRSEDLG